MKSKIYEVAGRLSIADPEWLVKLIKLESGFNPQAKNSGSTARGLIQVMDATAQSTFGVADSLTLISKYPDFNSQMDNVVYKYLGRWKPYNTAQSLYLAVFYPAARTVDPSTTFYSLYEKYAGSEWREKYAEFTRVNGDIRTVQDYVDMVEGTFYLKKGIRFSPLILAVGVVAYVLYRRGGI